MSQVEHAELADEVSPALAIDALFAFRRTAALTSAIRLDLFTMLASENASAPEIAQAIGVSERGARVLCDFLTTDGFLVKRRDRYAPTASSRVFLDRNSPAYMGSAADFMAAPEMLDLVLTDPVSYVRNGGSAGLAYMAPDHPAWVRFAKAMGPMSAHAAIALAGEVAGWRHPPKTVLDIAAGPGRFGIEIARLVPGAEIVAVDWPSVLSLSQAAASEAGVAERYRTIAGSAFEVDWGGDYDLILLPNFLHHFDMETCIGLFQKVRRSLSGEGRVVAVEFVPNEDRVSPPFEAQFAYQMLALTPGGTSYTGSDLSTMAQQAGFSGATVEQIGATPASLVFFDR